MRISDWSSYVCSSDLANIKHRPSGRRPSLYFMLLQILSILLNILWWIIIVQAVTSWLLAFNVNNTHNEFVRQLWYVLESITEQLYRPFRRLMPDFGGIDLTQMVELILLLNQYGRAQFGGVVGQELDISVANVYLITK